MIEGLLIRLFYWTLNLIGDLETYYIIIIIIIQRNWFK